MSSPATVSSLALVTMMFLPNEKTASAVIAQQAITPVIGNAVLFCSKLTSADVPAPIPIWTAPNKADALPALCPKDAKERADALGKTNPWQQRKINMKKIV